MKRVLPVLVGLLVVVGGGYGLLAIVHGRDAAGVTQSEPAGPGRYEADLGSAVKAGAGTGKFASPVPSSGDHARKLPTREGRIDDATLLTALALGDVAFVYGSARPPAALKRTQQDLTGAFDPELAAAGQAVVLVRRPGVTGVQALAWRHRLTVTDAGDARLGDFAQAWLGRGAPPSGG